MKQNPRDSCDQGPLSPDVVDTRKKDLRSFSDEELAALAHSLDQILVLIEAEQYRREDLALEAKNEPQR